jgi:hypothetical protein
MARELLAFDGDTYRRYVLLGSGTSGTENINLFSAFGVLCVRGAEGFSYTGPFI